MAACVRAYLKQLFTVLLIYANVYFSLSHHISFLLLLGRFLAGAWITVLIRTYLLDGLISHFFNMRVLSI